MKTLRLVALAALLLATTLGVLAAPPYDGLTPVSPTHEYQGVGSATLEMTGFKTKYGEKVVGMYFVDGNREVHFYMNAAVWDKMKQQLIKLRDQWQTISARELDLGGPIAGYRIANLQSTLRLAIQGATDIAPKQLIMTATGGRETRQSVTIALSNDNLKALVEDFDAVDAALRK